MREGKGVTLLEIHTKSGRADLSALLLTGFTLIELLVVIAIISLLMAMLAPALEMVRKQARAITCRSNLHQWGLVFATYSHDYSGFFMRGNRGGDEDECVTWVCVLHPFYKDKSVMLCPMANKPRLPAPGGAEPPGSTFLAWGVFDGTYWKYAGLSARKAGL